MTLETSSWQGQDNDPLTHVIETIDATLDDNKREEVIGKILTRIMTMCQTAPEVDEHMDAFHFPSAGTPSRHIPGYVKVGNFKLDKGIWVRATSVNASTLTQRIHNLFMYTGDPGDDPEDVERRQHRYRVAELPAADGGGTLRKPMEFVGIQAMAVAPYDLRTDLTKVETYVEMEQHARWDNNRVVTDGDVRHSRVMRRQS